MISRCIIPSGVTRMWIAGQCLRRFGNWRVSAIVAAAAVALLSAISATAAASDVATSGVGNQADCRQLYRRFETVVKAAGVRDVQAVPVSGFPYLRVNRFLASFREQPLTPAQRRQWLQRMHRLALVAREVEEANLPAKKRRALNRRGTTLSLLDSCDQTLLARVLARPAVIQHIRRVVHVPDEYSAVKRLFGLYPLAEPFLRLGIQNWHDKVRREFSSAPAQTPRVGFLLTYQPPPEPLATAHIAAWLKAARGRNPLAIPELTRHQRRRVLRHFAPILTVDTVGRFDRIGAPVWRKGQIAVDVARPMVYTHIAYARFHRRILLQLVYTAWFSRRPTGGPLDILAGRLDGLMWRVTLDSSGRVLAYDAVHPCGCYYEIFPSPRLRFSPAPRNTPQEPVLIPRTAPHGWPVVVRLSSAAHQIEGVDTLRSLPRIVYSRRYRLVSYRSLRSLPDGDGHKSLFGATGLVPGTDRPERFFLWSSGIASPGAMRQWGHHAIAFIGRRYFENPYLLQSLFSLRVPDQPAAGLR